MWVKQPHNTGGRHHKSSDLLGMRWRRRQAIETPEDDAARDLVAGSDILVERHLRVGVETAGPGNTARIDYALTAHFQSINGSNHRRKKQCRRQRPDAPEHLSFHRGHGQRHWAVLPHAGWAMMSTSFRQRRMPQAPWR
jgi:hypothetical protein